MKVKKMRCTKKKHPKMAQEELMLQVMRRKRVKKLNFGFADPALVG